MSGEAASGETTSNPDARNHALLGQRELLRIALLLVGVELGFAAIYAMDLLLDRPSDTIHSLFDLDRELTIPSWFSSIQLFTVGTLLAVLARANRDEPHVPTGLVWCIAAGFLLLSADETIAFHERITPALRHIEWLPRFRGQFGIWVFIYAAIGLAFLLGTRRGLLALRRRFRAASNWMLIGALVFLAGGLGLEIISYLYVRPTDPSALRYDEGALLGATGLYHTEVAVEEFLEMFGVTLMLYAAGLANLGCWAHKGPSSQ